MTQITVDYLVAESIIEAIRVFGLPEPTATDSNGTLGNQRTLTWTPDLTAQQTTTMQTIRQLAVSAVLITPAERDAIQSDVDGLIAYQAIGSPTLAQTAAATKAQNRILRAILRS